MTNVTLVAVHAAWILAATNSEFAKSVENELIRNPRGSIIALVTPEIREEVILRLRRSAYGFDSDTGAKTSLGRDSNALLVLLRLGDEQTIGEVMKEYHDVPGMWGADAGRDKQGLVSILDTTFPESVQPLLIPHLAREFFRDDLHKATAELMERDVFPASVGSAFYAMGIMKHSPVFSVKVREWAEKADKALRYHTGRDIVKYRLVMQQWWKDNARHFEAKNYAAVKPGAPLVTGFVPYGSLPAVVVIPDVEKVFPGSAKKSAVLRSKPGQAPVSAESSTPSAVLLWTGTGVTIALLMSLLFFWKRRSS